MAELVHNRRKVRKMVWPRWMEMEWGAVLACQRLFFRTPTGIVATNLSNLQRNPEPFPAPLFPPAETRAALEEMTGDANRCARQLGKFNTPDLVTWAPMDNDALSRMLSGLVKYRSAARETQNMADTRLHLLIQHEHYPGCTTPEQLLDLWWHPVLQQKHKDTLLKLTFLKDPIRCVTAGREGPMHQSKALAVATFSVAEQRQPPTVEGWRQAITLQQYGSYMIVDCEADHAGRVAQALQRIPNVTDSQILKWEGPLRSPASLRQEARVQFRGYVSPGTDNTLGIRLLAQALRDAPLLQQTLIASSRIYTDRSAVILEMGSPHALLNYRNIADQILPISTTKALTLPSAEEVVWSVRMTENVHSDPSAAVTKASSRISVNGGLAWAKPQELERNIRSARARARRGNTRNSAEGDTLNAVLLILRGTLGPRPDDLRDALMKTITQLTGLPLRKGGNDVSLRNNEWMDVRNGADEWCGNVRIQLADAQAVHSLHQVVRTYVVEVCGTRRHLELHGPAVPVTGAAPAGPAPSSGNAERAGR